MSFTELHEANYSLTAYKLHSAPDLPPTHAPCSILHFRKKVRLITSGTPDLVGEPPDTSFGQTVAEGKGKKFRTFITLSLIASPRPQAPGYKPPSVPHGRGGGVVLKAGAFSVSPFSWQRTKLFCLWFFPPKLSLHISFQHQCAESQDCHCCQPPAWPWSRHSLPRPCAGHLCPASSSSVGCEVLI